MNLPPDADEPAPEQPVEQEDDERCSDRHNGAREYCPEIDMILAEPWSDVVHNRSFDVTGSINQCIPSRFLRTPHRRSGSPSRTGDVSRLIRILPYEESLWISPSRL